MSLVVQDGHFVYYAFSSLCTFKSVFRLDLSLHPLSWVETKSMYYQRSQLGVAILNYWIYAVDGFNGNHELNEVEAFDVHTKELKMVSSMSTSRANVGVGVLDNFLYAIGGFSGVSRQHLNGWTSIVEMSICHTSPGVGVLNGQIYVIGGHDGQWYHKSVEVYNPKTKHWTSIVDMHVCCTNPGMSVVVLHGLLYVLGEEVNCNCNNLLINVALE
ncbi:unnamed protein product [Aphis gossypii]|uniref:Uncharacterized protein n=1 Tax=Aphis gossypii TaxID=80765 RepID=A0A9P0IVW8_APHGO|nr:unnamed protein product [Aphis gossypii]